jgi:integrase/recombinase XerD
MPQKLETVLKHVEEIGNYVNRQLIKDYHKYLVSRDTSTIYQKDNVKLIYMFAKFIGESKTLYDIKDHETIVAFLDTRKKTKEEDPEQRWSTTWNDYLWRLKMFYRWIYNVKIQSDNHQNYDNISNWITPDFVNINKKKIKRLSPYDESEIWDREELLSIVKYEPYKRNKAILTLLWDFNARPHEITLMRIKNLRLRDKYGEGEVPYEAKTGSGPILLTFSFPYVRDWLNEHPFKNEPNARLVCNLITGAPVKPSAIWDMMRQLKIKIKRLLDNNEITDKKERESLQYLVNTKKWNPYCIRHSSITNDSDYLPEYALKKKVRWSMNSRQGSRYIKNRMGNDLKEKILKQNGIILDTSKVKKSTIMDCPRCQLINQLENKYCSKCSYPLKPEAYEELKEIEKNEMRGMKEQINEMDKKFERIFMLIQQNPNLSLVKPKILVEEID